MAFSVFFKLILLFLVFFDLLPRIIDLLFTLLNYHIDIMVVLGLRVFHKLIMLLLEVLQLGIMPLSKLVLLLLQLSEVLLVIRFNYL